MTTDRTATISRDELAALLHSASDAAAAAERGTDAGTAGPDNGTVLVDVRAAWLYEIAHLPGAVNWPLSDASASTGEWPAEPLAAGTRYILYGVNRAQGRALAERMAGQPNVAVYMEGFRDWVAAELPTEPPIRGWACLTCSFGYYAHRGDLRGGAELGTLFEELPDDWCCPWCGAPKSRFYPE